MTYSRRRAKESSRAATLTLSVIVGPGLPVIPGRPHVLREVLYLGRVVLPHDDKAVAQSSELERFNHLLLRSDDVDVAGGSHLLFGEDEHSQARTCDVLQIAHHQDETLRLLRGVDEFRYERVGAWNRNVFIVKRQTARTADA